MTPTSYRRSTESVWSTAVPRYSIGVNYDKASLRAPLKRKGQGKQRQLIGQCICQTSVSGGPWVRPTTKAVGGITKPATAYRPDEVLRCGFGPRGSGWQLSTLLLAGLLLSSPLPGKGADIADAVPNPATDLWRAVRQRKGAAAGQTQVRVCRDRCPDRKQRGEAFATS